MKKLLTLGMTFPYDFGMVKNTLAEDGDPVDAMVFTECTTYPGVELKYRVIGALLARQTSPGQKTIRNGRYFFIPEYSAVYEHIKTIGDFFKKHNRQLADFFVNNNKADNKKF
ncbi:MAG: inorganic diphosphatase [Chitinophagaceae bacterium]